METYFAGKHGYVSIFDFNGVSDKKCELNRSFWGQFFFDHKPLTIILRLNRDMLVPKLIPNDSIPTFGPEAYIPDVEAVYPESVPFNAMNGFIISRYLDFNEHPIFVEFSDADELERNILIEEIRSLLPSTEPSAVELPK